MDFTINNQQNFPVGTTVKAYLRSNWQKSQLPAEGAPKGSPTAEAVVAANGDAVLKGLAENTNYYAVAEVGGVYRYVRFTTAVPKSSNAVTSVAGRKGDVVLAVADVENAASKAEAAAKASKAEVEAKASKAEVETNTAAIATKASKAEAEANAGAIVAGLAPYRTVATSAGRGTATAASGTKYLLAPGSVDVGTGGLTTTLGIVPINLLAADQAISGRTPKLRLVATCWRTTAPGVTITVGLYAVSVVSSSLQLGEKVTGSDVAFVTPAAGQISAANSGDFALPADGIYALGYIVSGTPAAGFQLGAVLQAHNIV